jgi:hypothetical protein
LLVSLESAIVLMTRTALNAAALLLTVCVVGSAEIAAETKEPATSESQDQTPLTATSGRAHTDVKGAIEGSLRLLMLEHLGRIAFQEKTRRELSGPFFSDYAHSVHVPDHWSDGDGWFVNYVGHPVHGAAAGYMWLDHDPHGWNEKLFSGGYWASRGRAAAWSAAFSLQFELGPLSEASIGNVGMKPVSRGWVDHVITPTGAFALMVGEDVLDRSFLKWAEARTSNTFVRAALRTTATPGRALSNIANGRVPWFRDGRPLNWDSK